MHMILAGIHSDSYDRPEIEWRL